MDCPNFFIIGAPKCGTSSLAWWLSQHPQVWFSRIKEPHFFNDDGEFRQVRSRPAYDDLFRGAGHEHLAVGEASTWYLFSDTAVPNIERYTGGRARYIVCLRDPVGMMPALHRQLLFSGTETGRMSAGHGSCRRRAPGAATCRRAYRHPSICNTAAPAPWAG